MSTRKSSNDSGIDETAAYFSQVQLRTGTLTHGIRDMLPSTHTWLLLPRRLPELWPFKPAGEMRGETSGCGHIPRVFKVS